VVALLAAAVEAGIAEARAPLEKSIAWVLSTRLPAGAAGTFPSRVEPGVPSYPSRAAWCYGDPGVVVALHHGARALGRPELAADVLALAIEAAGRPIAASGAVDAGLCHGSAGLLHLFASLFHATGEARFAEAARRWYENTLSYAHPEDSEALAGYRMVHAGGPSHDVRISRADGTFLTGIVGVGLALYSATSELDPGWDRLLVPRVPPES
jgi:lantibiotic biosynthesis protein